MLYLQNRALFLDLKEPNACSLDIGKPWTTAYTEKAARSATYKKEGMDFFICLGSLKPWLQESKHVSQLSKTSVHWFRCIHDLWTGILLGGSLWSCFKNVHKITLNLPDSSTICFIAGGAKTLQKPDVNTVLLLPTSSPPAVRTA